MPDSLSAQAHHLPPAAVRWSGPAVSLSIPSGRLEEVDMGAIAPFYRALLTLDGTVTCFLESWLHVPVEVRKLQQGRLLLEDADPRLDTPAGAEVIAREVLLTASDVVLAHARSYLVTSRLPSDVRRAIDVPGAGLGRVMDTLKLETYREILSRGWTQRLPEPLRASTQGPALRRTYRVFAGGRPIMLIQETFVVREG